MATETLYPQVALQKSNISSCIYKTCFGCLLLKQCKCINNKIDENERLSRSIR